MEAEDILEVTVPIIPVKLYDEVILLSPHLIDENWRSLVGSLSEYEIQMSSGIPISNWERNKIAVVELEEWKGPVALTF